MIDRYAQKNRERCGCFEIVPTVLKESRSAFMHMHAAAGAYGDVNVYIKALAVRYTALLA
jgi:hypothetical protein